MLESRIRRMNRLIALTAVMLLGFVTVALLGG